MPFTERRASADPEEPATLINLLPFSTNVLGDAHLQKEAVMARSKLSEI